MVGAEMAAAACPRNRRRVVVMGGEVNERGWQLSG